MISVPESPSRGLVPSELSASTPIDISLLSHSFTGDFRFLDGSRAISIVEAAVQFKCVLELWRGVTLFKA